MPHTLSYCALIGKCALIRSNTVVGVKQSDKNHFGNFLSLMLSCHKNQFSFPFLSLLLTPLLFLHFFLLLIPLPSPPPIIDGFMTDGHPTHLSPISDGFNNDWWVQKCLLYSVILCMKQKQLIGQIQIWEPKHFLNVYETGFENSINSKVDIKDFVSESCSLSLHQY